MDNQVTTPDPSVDQKEIRDQKEARPQKVALAILAILLVIAVTAFSVYHLRRSDPYVHSVLTATGDAGRGKVIFQQNCAVCHGVNADGRVGPSLQHVATRRSRVGLIHQVTSGQTPPMPQFQPSPQEMADLLKYLETL